MNVSSARTSRVRMGQYFTPEPVVNLMFSVTNPGSNKTLEKILDPACGSGRMGLSAATHALAQQKPCWVTMNDLDPICTKMAAVNMAMNEVVGKALCMNGLDVKGDSYRFGYRVEPIICQYPDGMEPFYRMLVLMKTGQDINKQYVLKPIPYDQSFLKTTNDQLLQELEKRQKISDEAEREKKVREFRDTIRQRMAETLFEGDEPQVVNVKTHIPKVDKAKSNKQLDKLD